MHQRRQHANGNKDIISSFRVARDRVWIEEKTHSTSFEKKLIEILLLCPCPSADPVSWFAGAGIQEFRFLFVEGENAVPRNRFDTGLLALIAKYVLKLQLSCRPQLIVKCSSSVP